MLPESPLNPKASKERHEVFTVPAMSLSVQAGLACYSYVRFLSYMCRGRTASIVKDPGDGVSHTCPFCMKAKMQLARSQT